MNRLWARPLFAAILGLLPAALLGAGLKQLPGHVLAVTKTLVPLGPLAATNQLQVAIGVPLRDPDGLRRFLADVYNPASPNYRHWLTPAEFAARFAATEADFTAVKNYALASGLTITCEHGNRLLLDVTGQTADVERAFHFKLYRFQHPTEARTFYAPDADPSVPAELAVADMQGLSDYFKPRPRKHRGAAPAGQPRSGTAPDGSGDFFGNDYRNAYAPGVTLTGAGQSVGLFEWDGFFASDVEAYASLAGNGRTNIPVNPILLGGFNGKPSTGVNADSGEVSLDIEVSMAMAPGLAAIYSFEGSASTSQNTILSAMASSNMVKNLSCSWGWPGPDGATTESIFMQMASQGQTFFNASGDTDAFTQPATTSANGVDNPAADNSPSDDAWVIQVGGTALSMNGSGLSYASEKVWNDGGGTGSSGGVSGYFAIPSWQTNTSMALNGGSTNWRNIPDVAAEAEEDQFMVYNNYGATFNANEDGWGGTSFAAPQWAGFMALVNQQAAEYGWPSLGFVNPAFYAIGNGANYTNCFHDTTSGNNEWNKSKTSYVAKAGYDLCTGWGSPNGAALINALAPPVRTNSPMMFYSVQGSALSLSWPPDHLGWQLESQTNSLTGSWYVWPGSAGVTNISITISPAQRPVFFRLTYP